MKCVLNELIMYAEFICFMCAELICEKYAEYYVKCVLNELIMLAKYICGMSLNTM